MSLKIKSNKNNYEDISIDVFRNSFVPRTINQALEDRELVNLNGTGLNIDRIELHLYQNQIDGANSGTTVTVDVSTFTGGTLPTSPATTVNILDDGSVVNYTFQDATWTDTASILFQTVANLPNVRVGGFFRIFTK